MKTTTRFSLLPHREDLATLFYNYMGLSRVFIVIVASILMQVARTLMDNWLGIWFQLHAVEKTDVLVDETSTTIHVK